MTHKSADSAVPNGRNPGRDGSTERNPNRPLPPPWCSEDASEQDPDDEAVFSDAALEVDWLDDEETQPEHGDFWTDADHQEES